MAAVFVIVDRDKCTGLGICESLDDQRFEIADDGSLIVHDDEGSETDRPLLEECVASCPTGALRLAESRP
ncbi:ferredoxin [Spongisporangium articulatum]|uniref:Ferredoxin n=1 Tax=Spongisporangium articulatum TaxID=3362603 RepID=A0ABW8ATM2_9ACTN